MSTQLWEWSGFALTATAIFLDMFKLAPDRIFWCMFTVAEAIYCGWAVLTGHWSKAGLYAAFTILWGYEWWRHRSDDDDSKNGRRFKSWARNKLKRFVPVALRPVEQGGAS